MFLVLPGKFLDLSRSRIQNDQALKAKQLCYNNEMPARHLHTILLVCCVACSNSVTDPDNGDTGPETNELIAWFKADALALTDGQQIATWPDSALNGYSATQAESSKQPTFQDNAVGGKPAVRFDGVDDVLVTAMFTPTLVQPATFFIVLKPQPSGSAVIAASLTNGLWLSYANIQYAIYAGQKVDTGTGPSGGVDLLTFVFDGLASEIYLNGVLRDREEAGPLPIEGLILGSNAEGTLGGRRFPFPGDLLELRLYQGRFDDVGREAVECALSSTYTLTIPEC